MKHLPTITLVAITTRDYGQTIEGLLKSLEHIKPAEVIYFSDIQYTSDVIRWQPIAPFRSVEDYNHFVFKKLADYVRTDHILLVQHDGYVIDAEAWTDEFIQYDYIGAPWCYTDGRNVGNGGFSLRSRKLHLILQNEEFEFTSPEDEKICRYYRQTLEKKYGIKFAPEALAHRFSFEMHKPYNRTFGFHNNFHARWKPPVVLKRSGAIGDVIMLEPVMEHLHNQGHHVVLDTPLETYELFAQHHFLVEHVSASSINLENARVINLDMAYEVKPKQLVLQSYYETCGITDGTLKNSSLRFKTNAKLFDKYVIMHVDDTEMSHRNVHGVDWEEIANYIQVFCGYPVYRVGRGNGRGGQKLNTDNLRMLAYFVANADYFIGIDSGISHVAVASQVKSMIFFGSVKPRYRYADLSNIFIMQKDCPISTPGCYHDVVSTVGQVCKVHGQIGAEPCITWTNNEVIKAVKEYIV